MTKSNRLDPVVRVAASKERDAARAMAELQRALDIRRAKLQELLSYRDEYRLQFTSNQLTGGSASRLNDFLVFLNKLDKAIAQQQRLIADTQRELERKRQRWAETRSKTKALEKVVDRYRQQEAATESRREQREADDRPRAAGDELEEQDSLE